MEKWCYFLNLYVMDFHEYITDQSDKPTVSNEDAIKDLAAVLATYESISKSIPINPKSYLTNDFR